MIQRKHDWPTIKAEYVEGTEDDDGNRIYPSGQVVAKKHEVNYGTLRNRIAKEGWVQERDLFMTKVEEARIEKKINVLAGKSAAFDSKGLKVAEGGLGLVGAKMQRGAQDLDRLSAADIAALSTAAKNYHQMGRLILGDSTERIDGAGPLVGNKIEVVFVNSPNATD